VSRTAALVAGCPAVLRPGQADSVPTLELPPETKSARKARQFVADVIGDAGVLNDTVALLVSEVASNAVLHARTAFVVTVVLDDSSIRVEVTDGSPQHPTMKQYQADSVTGRGLHLVDTAATRWGVDAAEPGKTVWFEVDRGSDGL
jgi:anti-sigma regulatory factor (Ser/Thr protein kinase)